MFAFLLLASPQICRIGLDLTSNIMDLLSIPDATNVSLVDESIFGTLTASWLMAIICSVIVMFKVLKLTIELAERYVILAMLALTAPLAFAMGGSKNTAGIFTGWCRMFGSMCLLMVTNLVCFKMLFSVVSTVPSGLDVLPWMVLIFAIVKVAHKSDEIITRIGLNPALTGGGGRTLLGTVVNTAVRTVTSQATKSVMGRLGFGSGASASGAQSVPAAEAAPTAARLPGVDRKAADGPAVPLAAGAVGGVPAAVRLPGMAPRASVEPVAAAGTRIKAPPSRQTPGRKTRPRPPPIPAIPAPLRPIPLAVADGPSRAGKAPCRPGASVPAAMHRPPAVGRPHRNRAGQAPPSRPTVPGPVRRGQRPEAALPVPAPQEQRQHPPRRGSPTARSPVRQEPGRPAPPTAPRSPRAGVR